MSCETAIVTRPALRYHGGKWILAPWILQHFPKHRIYCEPFGGGGSILLRKQRSYAEVYNDLDSEVVGMFRILRDPQQAARLRELVALTPFAREELRDAYELTDDPIEQARRLMVRSFQGFGSDSANDARRTGFRANSNRSGTTPSHDWANMPPAIDILAERMRGVTVENRDYAAIVGQHDGPQTLFYADPPYLHDTRAANGKQHMKRYRHEFTEADHRRMAEVLRSAQGMVVLSHYPCALYDEMFGDWWSTTRAALADGARKRTEQLWMNPAARQAMDCQARIF